MGKDGRGSDDPMTSDRRLRLWAVLAEATRGGPVGVDQVCATVVSVADVDSAAVAVVLDATRGGVRHRSDRIGVGGPDPHPR